MQREKYKIWSVEFSKNKQTIKIIEQAIALPVQIPMKLCQTFKDVKPAIMLPDHTPVIGKGTATKVVNKKIFLNVDVPADILLIFFLNRFFEMSVKYLFLNFFVRSMTGTHGIIEPKKAETNAHKGVKVFSASNCVDNAKGIAILPSNPGIKAIINVAKKLLSAKNDAIFSKNILQSILWKISDFRICKYLCKKWILVLKIKYILILNVKDLSFCTYILNTNKTKIEDDKIINLQSKLA